MKKFLAIALLAFIFTMTANAQVNERLGTREFFNQSCGPVWDWPDPVSCPEYFQLYVYYPLEIVCECEAPICLGWMYPSSEYCNIDESFSCQWDLYGEFNYWFEAIGSFSNGAGGSLTSQDGQVTLSDINWQTSIDDFTTFDAIPSDANGSFDLDFQLDGPEPDRGPYWGEREFRVWPGCVTTGAEAHGLYFWTATLWAQYNF